MGRITVTLRIQTLACHPRHDDKPINNFFNRFNGTHGANSHGGLVVRDQGEILCQPPIERVSDQVDGPGTDGLPGWPSRALRKPTTIVRIHLSSNCSGLRLLVVGDEPTIPALQAPTTEPGGVRSPGTWAHRRPYPQLEMSVERR